MLTVDFDRLGVGPDTKAIDIGAGQGRHSFEMFRRGADVIAFDQSESDMSDVGEMFDAMMAEGQVPASAKARAEVGDALRLPYADDSFDVVLMSEILEHIPSDAAAIAEMVRILRPGGVAAVTVPRYLAGEGLLDFVGRLSRGRGRSCAHLSGVGTGRQTARCRPGGHRDRPCARPAFPVLVVEMCCGSREQR